MNTTENNKLIAEFMGWDINGPTTIPTELHLSNLELDHGDVLELNFHTSWNWLMPVVEKIESLGYWVDRNLGDITIVDSTYTIIIPTPMSEGGKDMYYKAVVEFIKWYNENNHS